ncbi:cysteine-rich venom protein-like [Littorina saxatilis]|uniref:EGF-like domain-containing protein n=1 Tax=Littorina saxatilis TaxID=31220 RepID=A0AAN9AXU4_9CAEN
MWSMVGVLVGFVLCSASSGVRGLQVSENCEKKYKELYPNHTMCLVDRPQATAVTLTKATQHAIVHKHNQLRARVQPAATNMQKVVWDEKLATVAAKWARQCVIGHDDNKARQIPEYPKAFISQNAGFGHTSFNHAIDNWYREESKFTFGGSYVWGTGHYFQLVFHGLSRVGCGAAKCPHSTHPAHRICNYAAGLDTSGTPYTNGTSCAACPDHCDSATKKLCDCGGKICYRNGKVDVRTCKCKCADGFEGDNCEQRSCPNEDYLSRCLTASPDQCSVTINPDNCPILCGLCPKPCNGKECRNGGKLAFQNCTCNCRGGFSGPLCEKCPSGDKEDCPTRSTTFCAASVDHRAACPYRCKLCSEKDLPCQNKKCHHHGKLDTKTCTCNCEEGFTGDRCEVCPVHDKDYCVTQPVKMCTDYPHKAYWMEMNCPHKCSHCNETVAAKE